MLYVSIILHNIMLSNTAFLARLHHQSVLVAEMIRRAKYLLLFAHNGQQNANSTLMTPMISQMCSKTVRT